jgi:hypothetical protein
MSLHPLPLRPAPTAPPPVEFAAATTAHGRMLRRGAARLLRAASRALDRQAAALAAPRVAALPDLDREFHAEAGAPEGALYVNGQLVGLLPGVRRL